MTSASRILGRPSCTFLMGFAAMPLSSRKAAVPSIATIVRLISAIFLTAGSIAGQGNRI